VVGWNAFHIARTSPFTGELIQSFNVPRYASKWKFIDRIETPDERTVVVYLTKPMASFFSDTLAHADRTSARRGAECRWKTQKKTEKAASPHFLNHRVLKSPSERGRLSWRSGGRVHFCTLTRNTALFRDRKDHQRTARSGPTYNDLVYTVFGTSDVAILALKKGSIDMFWWPIQPGYMEDLKKAEVDPAVSPTRKTRICILSGSISGNPRFPTMPCVGPWPTSSTRSSSCARILQGHGTKMFSVVPAENRSWYCSDLPRYGDGTTKEERVRSAFRELTQGRLHVDGSSGRRCGDVSNRPRSSPYRTGDP
jgi:peptide/nickel transport system substrate-binding protein